MTDISKTPECLKQHSTFSQPCALTCRVDYKHKQRKLMKQKLVNWDRYFPVLKSLYSSGWLHMQLNLVCQKYHAVWKLTHLKQFEYHPIKPSPVWNDKVCLSVHASRGGSVLVVCTPPALWHQIPSNSTVTVFIGFLYCLFSMSFNTVCC